METQLIILAEGKKSPEVSFFQLDYFPQSEKAKFHILLSHYILKRKHHLLRLYVKKKAVISGQIFILLMCLMCLMHKHNSAGTLNPMGLWWGTQGTFGPFDAFPKPFQMWFFLSLPQGAKPHHHSI